MSTQRLPDVRFRKADITGNLRKFRILVFDYGLSWAQAGRRMGCSERSVAAYKRRHEEQVPRNRPIASDGVRDMIAYYEKVIAESSPSPDDAQILSCLEGTPESMARFNGLLIGAREDGEVPLSEVEMENEVARITEIEKAVRLLYHYPGWCSLEFNDGPCGSPAAFRWEEENMALCDFHAHDEDLRLLPGVRLTPGAGFLR
jgi:hypothetical protein